MQSKRMENTAKVVGARVTRFELVVKSLEKVVDELERATGALPLKK